MWVRVFGVCDPIVQREGLNREKAGEQTAAKQPVRVCVCAEGSKPRVSKAFRCVCGEGRGRRNGKAEA